MADLSPKNHSFALVNLMYGTHRIHGFAEGEPISWAPNAETISGTQGADGGVAINKKGLRLSRLTIRVMASSLSTTVLSALFNVHSQDGYLGPYPPIMVTDINTGSTLVAPAAWIVQSAAFGLGEESGTFEWVVEGLFVANLKGSLI